MRNFGLSRPHRLLSAGALICRLFTGWLSHQLVHHCQRPSPSSSPSLSLSTTIAIIIVIVVRHVVTIVVDVVNYCAVAIIANFVACRAVAIVIVVVNIVACRAVAIVVDVVIRRAVAIIIIIVVAHRAIAIIVVVVVGCRHHCPLPRRHHHQGHRPSVAIIIDVVAHCAVAIIVEVVARRAIAIVIDVIIRGVVIVIVVVDLHPHANPLPQHRCHVPLVECWEKGHERGGGVFTRLGHGDGHFLAATKKKGNIMDSCMCGEHDFYMKINPRQI